jgi:hypothetical protein
VCLFLVFAGFFVHPCFFFFGFCLWNGNGFIQIELILHKKKFFRKIISRLCMRTAPPQLRYGTVVRKNAIMT